jgi:hypothetical protein
MRVGAKVPVTIRYLAAVLAVLLCGNALAREKTDIVWMSNGDRLTGEIKHLQHGKLLLSTDSLGDVNIEWDEIERVQSDYEFQFERTDGRRVTGAINPMTDQHKISLTSDETTIDLALDNIVRISQMEDDFWDRLDGSMSFGYSFTKASDVAQGNISFRVRHRTEIRSFTVEGSSIVTNDQADEGTQRTDLGLDLTRYRNNRWFNSFVVGFESNDELGLDMRSSFGASIGRFLVQTSTSELGLMGGLIASTENLSASGPPTTEGNISSQENLEGLLGLQYSRFVFDDPSVDLTTKLTVFPSITDPGRTRAQLDINFRWEMVSDLFWDLSYYNTYDSDPPSGSLSTNDYGMVTSIGWSF